MSAEWAAAEDWRTYELRMLTGSDLVHPLAEVQSRIRTFCAKYGKAEDSVELDRETGKWRGIKLFTINF